MNTATLCNDLRCDHSTGERPRYYARQLITADDMTLEQDYFRSRLRLHNRMLHGWGIVCGAEVEKLANPDNKTEFLSWKVVIKPGYILSPYGDEIVIDCVREFDLREESLISVTGEACVEESDPWCSEVRETRNLGPLSLAIRYKEVMTRPVRVQPSGCGCNDSACEYSRLRDGYEIKVLKGARSSQKIDNEPIGCPPCPEDPWVLLAKITLETDGKVSSIDRSIVRILATQSEALSVKKQESVIILTSDSDRHEESSRERIVIPSVTAESTAEKAAPAKRRRKNES